MFYQTLTGQVQTSCWESPDRCAPACSDVEIFLLFCFQKGDALISQNTIMVHRQRKILTALSHLSLFCFQNTTFPLFPVCIALIQVHAPVRAETPAACTGLSEHGVWRDAVTHYALSDSLRQSFLLPIDPDYHKAEVSGPKQFKQSPCTTQYPVIESLSAADTSKTGKSISADVLECLEEEREHNYISPAE